MSVWLALPSIRPAAQVEPVLKEWTDRGYKTAVLREGPPITASLLVYTSAPYTGWTTAINSLISNILWNDPQAQWIVAGGDDLLPIMEHTADDIADSCTVHLAMEEVGRKMEVGDYLRLNTFGVMQPTGDRYRTPGSTLPYPDVEHSACSPWIGREFCERAYGGRGPMHPGYRHYWGDNELQEVAKLLGCFWQRPDLTQLHQHWSRDPNATCPEHLRAAHEGGAEVDRLLFESRKAAGFPGHELRTQFRSYGPRIGRLTSREPNL